MVPMAVVERQAGLGRLQDSEKGRPAAVHRQVVPVVGLVAVG